MKKNIAMRLASGLMLSCLLSTCVISGTFAKYTTTASGTDTARVAQWGFEANKNSIVLDTLFSTAYTDDNGVLGKADVIAPGTTNSVDFKFEYVANNKSATPEVDYTFVVDTTGSNCATDIQTNPNIIWYLDGQKCENWNDLLAGIKALSGDASGTKTYEAGFLPTAFDEANEKHTIKWEWLFETAGNAEQDKTDTAMGNEDELAQVTLVITITATQID